MANSMVHPTILSVLIHQVVKSIIISCFFEEKILFSIIDNYNN